MEDGETMIIETGWKKFFTRVTLATAALLGMLAFAGAPRASAESYDSCQRRIAKADHRLHEAVEHHGWNSRQADRARHDLHEARERCWNERLAGGTKTATAGTPIVIGTTTITTMIVTNSQRCVYGASRPGRGALFF